MNKSTIATIAKWVIWACLGAIVFSVLYVESRMFFPFIVGKTLVFQIATEIMFLAFLCLSWADGKYRLRFNWAVILIGAYLIILTIASAFGNDFYHSFWSNNERSDGLLLLTHLFLFVLVLSSFLRDMKNWLAAFDVFFGATVAISIVAMDQFFALTFPGSWSDHFLASSNGARLAVTIGNAGYVAGYLVFAIFIGLFLFFKRKNNYLKYIYYLPVVLLQYFLTLETQTRGGMIALFIATIIFGCYLIFFYFNNKIVKIIGLVAIIASIVFAGWIFANKNSQIVKSVPALERLTSISLSDATTNNRFATWGFAFQGFKQSPILGYGQENFYQVFDRFYTTKNTEQWFDRSHNMIFDRLITGGLIGLISYLALLILPFYFMWQFYRKENENKEITGGQPMRRYLTPVLFAILILGYIIQNMFIFEALATYIPLMLILSFAGLYSKHFNWKFLESPKFKSAILVIVVIMIIPFVYIFNLRPASANMDLIKIISTQNSISQTSDSFEYLLSQNTFGNQEYRRQYFSWYAGALDNYIHGSDRSAQTEQDLAAAGQKVENQLIAQIQENPHSVSNYLLLMNFYNSAYFFDITRLDRAIKDFDYAIKLSPGRPQVYYTVATSYYYLAGYYDNQKKPDLMALNYQKAFEYFYLGAGKNLNHSNSDAFNGLFNFLGSVNKNPSLMTAISSGDYNGQGIVDVLKNVSSWISFDDQKKQFDDFVNILISANPKDKQLQDKLTGLLK